MCKMVTTTPPPKRTTTPSPMMSLLEEPQDASTKSTRDDKKDNANKSKKKNNNKKRVQFFPTCTVKTTISYHNMTDKEIQATWLQQDEEKAIRRRVHNLIRKNGFVNSENNNNIVSVDDDDECMRGLENIKERRWNRQSAREEVFDEQDRQDLQYYTGQSYHKSMNSNDDEKIASLYKTCSLKCLISARLIAIQDRNDIENYIMPVLL
ncbi:hypothetical protein FRACYDRAFT_235279 [Fragilariopsis cylindrus CCMP1102]|uniref:Uncharacterized protein n=1 Tax=Fragilariopsis cylindrus CCMP1102 TaxID=635003 RepID=A0A1E7FN65_9STRA|nr:hypothetical protein FRACYDRAFT_235279 [Fragilariopsis cylindrus CCMP1102]|eukprot:OEU19233.1 hypothetical protein FRACYDRAFT_235279 [Fragilariopsis cylindrus CCMP1102]